MTSSIFVATTEQIDKAKEVIKKLTFEFQSDSFENPGNQNTCVTTSYRSSNGDHRVVRFCPSSLSWRSIALRFETKSSI